MRPSIVGSHLLPESEDEFKSLDVPKYRECGQCREGFSSLNTHSKLAWAETQISGLCEDCFDILFEEVDDES